MTVKQRIFAATKAAYEANSSVSFRRWPLFDDLCDPDREEIIRSYTAGLVAGGFIPAAKAKVKGKRKSGGR